MTQKQLEQEWEIYSPLFTEAREMEKVNPETALEKYMYILSHFTPMGTLYYERPAILLERNKRYQEAISVCELALKNLARVNPHTYQGTKDDFKKRIERCKRKMEKANGQGEMKPKSRASSKPKTTQENSSQNTVSLAKKEEIATPEIVFPYWYVSISFGHSRSESFSKALHLAKSAPQFLETEQDGQTVYQAVYSNFQSEYLAFIKLYELIKNWKSCFVIINGEHIDRKILGQINYCYGDCCRSGDPNFCYGASMFTDNPFGCHRLQISAYNHPWYSFGYIVNNRYLRVDKKQILERAASYAEIYKYCPNFNWDKIKSKIDALPEEIDIRKHPELRISGNTVIRTDPIVQTGNAGMTSFYRSNMSGFNQGSNSNSHTNSQGSTNYYAAQSSSCCLSVMTVPISVIIILLLVIMLIL